MGRNKESASLGRDSLIMRPSIRADLIHMYNTLGIFSISGHFLILILKVSILTLKISIFKDINAQKIEMLLHAQIGPAKLMVS